MILDQIRQMYADLTPSQKRLADYIASTYHEAAFATASCVAQTMAMNESTVIRFAQRLGYDGYPEFVRDLQEIIRQELGAEQAAPAEPDVLAMQLRSQLDALARVVSHISPSFSSQVFPVLCKAERIYILGHGASAALAHLFAYLLRCQGFLAENPPADASGMAVWLREVAPEIAVVGLSTTAEGEQVANALRYARSKGARTVALCCSPVSPCAQAAEMALACAAGDQGGLPEISALALLVEGLVKCLSCARGARADSAACELDQVRACILDSKWH